MRVDIDDAGHERQAVRIDLAACAAGKPANFNNAPVADSDVGSGRHAAAAVVNRRPANQQIEHARTLSQHYEGTPLISLITKAYLSLTTKIRRPRREHEEKRRNKRVARYVYVGSSRNIGHHRSHTAPKIKLLSLPSSCFFVIFVSSW